MSSGQGHGRNSMPIIAGHLIVDPADRDRYVADCAMAVVQARARCGLPGLGPTADSLDPARSKSTSLLVTDAQKVSTELGIEPLTSRHVHQYEFVHSPIRRLENKCHPCLPCLWP
jgi:hypothetical protein